MPAGSIVKFAGGKDYILLNPSQGLIYSVNSIGNRKFDINNGYFKIDAIENIGYYLNNVFYNTLSEKEKSMILTSNWNAGGVSPSKTGLSTTNRTYTISEWTTVEKSRVITAKVGLLSTYQFYLYSERHQGSSGLIKKDWFSGVNSWLLNGSLGNSGQAFVASTYGFAVVNSDTSLNMNVRPAMYLDPNLYVLEDGTVTSNAEPIITTSSTPSGPYASKPSFNYTVADAENDAMTITESIDGILFNTRIAVASGTQLTFTPTDLAWLRTRIKQTVNITITADDGKGGVTTVNIPITRTASTIDLQLKIPFETDIAARRLLLQLEGNIPADAVVSVQACNNAFDTSPTWENATNLVLSGFPYPFNNKVKTAAKWGVSFKVRIERGGSTQPIYIDGLGGAFD